MTARLTWLQCKRCRNRIAVAADLTLTAWCHRTVTCRQHPQPMLPTLEQVAR